MTITEAAQAIERETHSLTWAEATIQLRVLVIQGIIDQVTAQPEEAAKKVVKQRKPRKPKTAPLTQHVVGMENE